MPVPTGNHLKERTVRTAVPVGSSAPPRLIPGSACAGMRKSAESKPEEKRNAGNSRKGRNSPCIFWSISKIPLSVLICAERFAPGWISPVSPWTSRQRRRRWCLILPPLCFGIWMGPACRLRSGRGRPAHCSSVPGTLSGPSTAIPSIPPDFSPSLCPWISYGGPCSDAHAFGLPLSCGWRSSATG